MSSSSFKQKSAEELSLEGRKVVSYGDIDQQESSSVEEERDFSYGTGPRDESGHEEGTADHQDRAWYYGEGEGEVRKERKERKERGVVHRYVDMDKPAGEKTTK